MGEEGKELLKEHIKNKRISEGLAEIPEDLFAKKPRYELTDEEMTRRNERRQKNKEAAEKSRKKKKEEFEKLQCENDQLQQDKCELVAMIETLKLERSKIEKENSNLRCNIEQLKRWIGKRAKDLGLGKHMHKTQGEGKVTEVTESDNSDCLLRGGPSLHSAESVADPEHQLLPSSSPSLSSDPRSPASSFRGPESPSPYPKPKSPILTGAPSSSGSFSQHDHKIPSPPLPIQRVSTGPSPPISRQDHFQPVGFRTLVSVPPLGTQVAVEQPKLQGEAVQREGGIYNGAKNHQPVVPQITGVPLAQPMQISDGKQLVYIPKDAIFIVQDENGQQAVTPIPDVRQVTMATPEMQQFTMATPEVHYVTMVTQEGQEITLVSPEMKQVTMTNPEVNQVAMKTTEMQQVIVEHPEAQTTSDDSVYTRKSFHVEENGNPLAAEISTNTVTNTENAVPDTTSISQPSVVSAIESLLQMGCKIQLPHGAQLVSSPASQRIKESDHGP